MGRESGSRWLPRVPLEVPGARLSPSHNRGANSTFARTRRRTHRLSQMEADLEAGGGLHPHLVLTLPRASPSWPGCSRWTYLDLSPSFILDRFQLSQLHTEGRLGAYDPAWEGGTISVRGYTDLEGPVNQAGRVQLLLRVGKGEERVRIPLHMRYQRPVQTRQKRADRREIEVESPLVFQSCPLVHNQGVLYPLCYSCLSRLDIGPTDPHCHVDSLPFDHHPFPASNRIVYLNSTTCPPSRLPPLSLSIPTGVMSDLPYVEAINFLAIWLGTAYIVWKAFRKKGAKDKRE